MIIYDMPYRGPFEYDKMVLNYLQFHNESIYLKKKIEKLSEEIDIKIQDEINIDKLLFSLYNQYFLS